MQDSIRRPRNKSFERPSPVATVTQAPHNNVLLSSPVRRASRSISIDGMRTIELRKPSEDINFLTERHWRVVYRTMYVSAAGGKSTPCVWMDVRQYVSSIRDSLASLFRASCFVQVCAPKLMSVVGVSLKWIVDVFVR
jgi:hypothetical protein